MSSALAKRFSCLCHALQKSKVVHCDAINTLNRQSKLAYGTSFSYDHRQLTANEVATALRPFYFKVHPDRFWSFPVAREINETSLKLLNQHLGSLASSGDNRQSRRDIKFYIRKTTQKKLDEDAQLSIDDQTFTQIQIRLAPQDDLNDAVERILSSCELPIDYLRKIGKVRPKESAKNNEQSLRSYRGRMDAFWIKQNIHRHAEKTTRVYAEDIEDMIKFKPKETLLNWLNENMASARDKDAATKPVREEILKLNQELVENLQLDKIIWDSNWSISHYRGCLASLKILSQQRSDDMILLRKRTVVFGSKTGISFKGHIILNTEDVRQNWIKLIRTADNFNSLIEQVPQKEAFLSASLAGIQVRHRKFKPSILIQSYIDQLFKLTRSILEFKNGHDFPAEWGPNEDDALRKFELVVECDAGPLMLSPTGQFIAPSSCPASILVAFITENLDKATHLIDLYNKKKNLESYYVDRCLVELCLAGIDKDDNVTPDLMIQCIERLLDKKQLLPLLKNTRVRISIYYALQETGEICIPWNWTLHE